MADQTDEQKRYNTQINKDNVTETANKMPADRSEQKTTRSTEGTVERTTNDARKQ